MKIKNSIVILLIIAFSTSCSSGDKQKALEGYFVKNNVVFQSNVEHLVLTNKADFDTYFGVAKTMKNDITEVNFETNNVLAIISKPSDNTKLGINSMSEDNNMFTIDYQLSKKEKQSHTSSDVKLFTIPKTVKQVKFVSGETSKLVDVL